MDLEARILAQVITQTDIIAAAAIKAVTPRLDDLSTRKAYALYGRDWVEAMVKDGRLQAHRQGGKMIISRHECESLRAVQKALANEQLKHITSK